MHPNDVRNVRKRAGRRARGFIERVLSWSGCPDGRESGSPDRREGLPQDTDSGWDWLCILMRYGKPAEMLM